MYLDIRLISKSTEHINDQADFTTLNSLQHNDITLKGSNNFHFRFKTFADESHIDNNDHPCLLFLDKPLKIPQENNNPNDSYPWLDKEDPCRNMTDMEVLKLKVKLHDSILDEKQREDFYKIIYDNRDVFSMRDEIGTCPQIQVHLKLQDETPFFL